MRHETMKVQSATLHRELFYVRRQVQQTGLNLIRWMKGIVDLCACGRRRWCCTQLLQPIFSHPTPANLSMEDPSCAQ